MHIISIDQPLLLITMATPSLEGTFEEMGRVMGGGESQGVYTSEEPLV